MTVRIENNGYNEAKLVHFTLEDYVDAIEKNGLPQFFGTYFEYDHQTTKITAACALGQGRINLHSGVVEVDHKKDYDILFHFQNYAAELNDISKLSLAEIAARAKIEFAVHMGINLHSWYTEYDVA